MPPKYPPVYYLIQCECTNEETPTEDGEPLYDLFKIIVRFKNGHDWELSEEMSYDNLDTSWVKGLPEGEGWYPDGTFETVRGVSEDLADVLGWVPYEPIWPDGSGKACDAETGYHRCMMMNKDEWV